MACAARDIGGGSRRQKELGVTAVSPLAGGRRPAGTLRTEQLGVHPAPSRAGRLGAPPTTPLPAPLPPCLGKTWSKQPLQGPPQPPATERSKFQVLRRRLDTSPGTEVAVEYAEKDLASVLLGINHWVWVCSKSHPVKASSSVLRSIDLFVYRAISGMQNFKHSGICSNEIRVDTLRENYA